MSKEKLIYGLKITLPILIALISIFIIAPAVSSEKYTGKYMETIDANKESVMKLTASSTSVSVAISALPGDFATPVSEKLADLSMGFMVVLCAIYLEKFLISITGLIVFKWMVPAVCLLSMFGFVLKIKRLKDLAYKIAVIALAIVLVIPASVSVTKAIRNVYGDTIDETIKSAELSASLLKESMEAENVDESTAKGLGKVVESLKNAGDTVASGTSEFMKYLERLASRFVEAVAILIVTSCIIPLLVIVGIAWFIKIVFVPDLMINIKGGKNE